MIKKRFFVVTCTFLAVLAECHAAAAAQKPDPRPQSVTTEPTLQQQPPSQTCPDDRVHVELEAMIFIDLGIVKVMVRVKTYQGETLIKEAATWVEAKAGDAARWTGDQAGKVADRVRGWFRR